jgi:hypothetical protein
MQMGRPCCTTWHMSQVPVDAGNVRVVFYKLKTVEKVYF